MALEGADAITRPFAGRGGARPEAAHSGRRSLRGRESRLSKLTVRQIIERARVSRRTFYDLFEGKEAAVAAACDEALSQLCEQTRLAWGKEKEWSHRVAASTAAALEWTSANPEQALLIADPAAALRDEFGGDRLLERFGPALRQGRSICTNALSPSCEVLLLDGAISVTVSRLRSRDASSLADLTPVLTAFLLTPYLG